MPGQLVLLSTLTSAAGGPFHTAYIAAIQAAIGSAVLSFVPLPERLERLASVQIADLGTAATRNASEAPVPGAVPLVRSDGYLDPRLIRPGSQNVIPAGATLSTGSDLLLFGGLRNYGRLALTGTARLRIL
jgi:hypothetical protein